ncbi:MAG: hypothetical protein MZV65_31995 [Chromatiales bacterium]|nr:hypothetical protein [Chromatiales bacterium]
MENDDQALRELAEKISKDAEKIACSLPPFSATLSVLMLADQVIRHMHTHREHLDPETLAVLNLAAATLYHCSHLFPPTLNFDGSDLDAVQA